MIRRTSRRRRHDVVRNPSNHQHRWSHRFDARDWFNTAAYFIRRKLAIGVHVGSRAVDERRA